MRGFGMEPHVDPASNIFGSRAGSDQSLRPILFGSHIGSVPNGGSVTYKSNVKSLAKFWIGADTFVAG